MVSDRPTVAPELIALQSASAIGRQDMISNKPAVATTMGGAGANAGLTFVLVVCSRTSATRDYTAGLKLP